MEIQNHEEAGRRYEKMTGFELRLINAKEIKVLFYLDKQ